MLRSPRTSGPRLRLQTNGQAALTGRFGRRLRFEPLELRALLAGIAWDGGGGDVYWDNPANWDTDTLPGTGDDVTIPSMTPGVTVIHDSGPTYIKSLTTYKSLELQTYTLNVSGHVQVDGSLTVTSSGRLEIGNGLTLKNNAIATLGNSAFVKFLPSASGHTLGGTGEVQFTPGSSAPARIYVEGTLETPTTLTIGRGITLHATGYGEVGRGAYDTLVNQGTILADGIGAQLRIVAAQFTNAGFPDPGTVQAADEGVVAVEKAWDNAADASIKASSGGTVKLLGATGTNTGTIVADGGTLTLAGDWDNSGGTIETIEATNATVNLGGTFQPSNLGTFTRSGGTVYLTGTLQNTGQTLDLDDSGLGKLDLNGGTIQGGIVAASNGSALAFINNEYNVLDGVTLDTKMDLNSWPLAPRVKIANGLTLNGTATMGDKARIEFQESAAGQELKGTGEVVFAAAASTPACLNVYGKTTPTTLKIGPDMTVRGSGQGVIGTGLGTTVENQGTIIMDGPGAKVTIVPQAFSNPGTLRAENGGQVVVNRVPAEFSAGTLTGGTWEVFAKSTLWLPAGCDIDTNAAAVRLEGLNSKFEAGTGIDALANLATNAAEGVLEIIGGRDLSTAGDLANAGTLGIGAESTLNVGNSFSQTAAGVLNLELDADCAQLAATGAATLDGTLNLSLADGFSPSPGETFQVVTANPRGGEFHTITGTNLGGCLVLSPNYNLSDLTLEVIAIGGVEITDLSLISDPIDEGDTAELHVSLTKGNPEGEPEVVISWGDGSADTEMTLALEVLDFFESHPYDDDPAGSPDQYTITVTISGYPCGSETATIPITVNNVAPTATLSNDGPVDEGGTTVVTFADQSDPSAADVAAGFTYSYDFDNDGTFEIVGSDSPTADVPASLLSDGPGGVDVRAQIVDKDGGVTELTTAITVHNVAPSATLSNDGPADEGGTAAVVFADQSDPSDADVAAGFTYNYDFGADGTFEIVGSDSPVADVLENLLLDGPGSVDVRAQIVDKDGGLSELTTTITVNNVAPAVDPIDGPNVGVRGQELTFVGSFTDPGVLDTHTTEWQVVDGAGTVVATGSGTELSFTPTVADTYTVSFTVTDNDGDSGDATLDVNVDAVQVIGGVLFVGGTSGGGKIDLKKGSQPGSVLVRIDKTDLGEFEQIERLVVFGQDGKDDIKVHKNLGPIHAELFGGPGNDKLRGGQGDDVLVGGPGDDLLHGHDGRDLLIGGDGRDKVIGHKHDDVLIGGSYVEQTNRMALYAVMAEWTRDNLEYAGRVAHLSDGGGLNGDFLLNGSTVFDDGVKDSLKGNQGLDWFLADDDDDKTDLEVGEILTDIELAFITTP